MSEQSEQQIKLEEINNLTDAEFVIGIALFYVISPLILIWGLYR